HSTNVFDEAEAKHRRDRPQLAHSQRHYRLIFANEKRDVVEIEVTFGVSNQLDGDFVGARISGESSCRELGQLFVVALGKARPDLSDVLLDDVEIVEQPVPRRTD